jgi:hypothetical protein
MKQIFQILSIALLIASLAIATIGMTQVQAKKPSGYYCFTSEGGQVYCKESKKLCNEFRDTVSGTSTKCQRPAQP